MADCWAAVEHSSDISSFLTQRDALESVDDIYSTSPVYAQLYDEGKSACIVSMISFALDKFELICSIMPNTVNE